MLTSVWKYTDAHPPLKSLFVYGILNTSMKQNCYVEAVALHARTHTYAHTHTHTHAHTHMRTNTITHTHTLTHTHTNAHEHSRAHLHTCCHTK